MPNPARATFARQEAIAAKVSLNPFNGWLSELAITLRVSHEYRPFVLLPGIGW
jgi:hypothetical protein